MPDGKMGKRPFMKLHLIVPAIAALVCTSCEKTQEEDPFFKEPVPETFEFVNATVSYYGDTFMSGVSDLWLIELTDGTSHDDSGNTESGYRINISLNSRTGLDETPELARLEGNYRMPSNSGDMSALTYNQGYLTEEDRPNGSVTIPAGSYLIHENDDYASADLLREGYCSVNVDDNGTVTIEGIMIGTEYLKRYFKYTGTPTVNDRTDGDTSSVPNTNLTGDIELSSLSATRLVDKGDSYYLGDQSYRNFEFYIADEGIDLSQQWPGGDGELIRLEIFVPWETDPTDGVPAGTYTVPENIPPSGGMYKTDIVPFRIVPGYPDKFTNNTGTWYQYMENGKWVRYARITGGTVTVERPEGRYRITADLTDCGDPAHHVTFTWEN